MWPRLALGDLLDKRPLTGQKEPTRKEGEKPRDRGWAQAARLLGEPGGGLGRKNLTVTKVASVPHLHPIPALGALEQALTVPEHLED